MLDALLAAVEQAPAIAALRQSVWVYPLVNAGHVTGIALLFGAIAPLDLRLLGLWREVPVAQLARVLLPVAATGLVLAALTGALMFAVSAGDFAARPLFLAKLGLVAAGVANALWLRHAAGWRALREGGAATAWPRLAAAVSLVTWLAVIVCGRLLGYR